MKALHYINCFFYLITIIPYLTIYYAMVGMYVQFILGFVQIIIAIILLFYTKKYNKNIKEHILYYWSSVLVILFIILALSKSNNIGNDIIQIAFIIIIPMLIASYFVYITYLIQKQ